LQAVAKENLQERSNEAEKAEQIVVEEVASFIRWIHSLEQAPTIMALRHRFEEVRRNEMEKSLGGGLKDLSDRQRESLEVMTTAMINKLLHGPISHLKKNAEKEDDESALYSAALKKLFNIEEK
jgi:glutamyl-tRNA reductase